MDTATNLIDPDLIPSLAGPPHELFDVWRERDPVHWNPPQPGYETPLKDASLEKGFWVLTRYKDVFEASRDQKLFCSHEGGPIIWDFEGEGLAMQQANLMGMKYDTHIATKRLVLPPFSPKALSAFEPEIHQLAKEIVDSVAGRGACEFVLDVAARLPVYTFCKLMGIPEELRERVFHLGNMLADTENPAGKGEDNAAAMEVFAIADQLSAEKRHNPDGSMLSNLIHGEVEGRSSTSSVSICSSSPCPSPGMRLPGERRCISFVS